MFAEALLDMAKSGTKLCVLIVKQYKPDDVALYALSLKLAARKAIAFRAIVEDWNRDRIVRELN